MTSNLLVCLTMFVELVVRLEKTECLELLLHPYIHIDNQLSFVQNYTLALPMSILIYMHTTLDILYAQSERSVLNLVYLHNKLENLERYQSKQE